MSVFQCGLINAYTKRETVINTSRRTSLEYLSAEDRNGETGNMIDMDCSSAAGSEPTAGSRKNGTELT
jgi:hypothetical protein